MPQMRLKQLASDGATAEDNLRYDGTSWTVVKNNHTTSDPGINDDSSAGYAVGSRWVNTSSDTEFVCMDAAVAGAVWKETTVTTSVQEASSTVGITSSTDVLINSMTVTPASGTYLVWFSALAMISSKTIDPFFSIYAAGSQAGQSERAPEGEAVQIPAPISTMARVTVNGTQSIEARARTPSGTFTFYNRQLMILKTGD